MIPLHLTIQGLYSYQGQSDIDFTRLTEAGLFGIFGAVGSGKTTILEAMSLCLYGRTERFSLSGDNRYYNMLNLKVNRGLISFTFLAGGQSKKYRAEFHLRRNNRNFDDVKADQHLYYLLEEGKDPKPIEQALVLQDLGISYDNFKRTLVIPQGQFREFLELRPRERTDMLKDLFGLHRFDMGNKVTQLVSENKSNQTSINGALGQLSSANPEVLQSLEASLISINASIVEWTSQFSSKAGALQDAVNLKDLSEKYVSTRASLDVLMQHVERDVSMEDRIKHFEFIRERYSILLRDLDQFTKGVKDLRQSQQVLQVKHDERELLLQQARSELETGIIEKLAAEALKPRADELFRMVDIRRLASEISRLDKLVQTETSRIEDGKSKIEAEVASIAQLESEIESLQSLVLPDQLVTSMRIFYNDLNRLRISLDKQENEYKRRKDDMSSKQQILNGILERVPARLNLPWPEVLTASEVNNATEVVISAITVERKELREIETALAVRKGLSEYAGNLFEGEPCALCGATHHPNPLIPDHADAEMLKVIEEFQALEVEERIIRDFAESLKSCIRETQQAARELEVVQVQVDRLNDELKTHVSSCEDETFGPQGESNFLLAEEASSQAKMREKQLNDAIRKHRENIDKWTPLLSGIEQSKMDTQLKVSASQARYDDAVATLVNLQLTDYISRDVNEIEQERTDILKRIEQSVNKHDAIAQKVSGLEKEIVDIKARLDESARNLEKQQQLLTALQTALESTLSEDGIALDRVRDVLQWNPDLVAIRKEMSERREKISSLTGMIGLLETQIAGRTYDAEQHRLLAIAVNEAESALRKLTETRGATEESIRKTKSDIAERQRLEEALRQLQIRGKDLATLQEMFRASGFVEFVSLKYLENVVAIANKRFRKMVREKFSIELSQEGDFLVRDYLNGGKTRLLKSLSGGQTFQAALCLALALSENIQHTAGAEQHFFFIDEGFGSLDSQSLETVFATLRSLQQDRKAVGVISHVAELQQGMDIYLQVENDPETGTRVRESWK
jgi:DNA repair protein SbcC/Rad50